MPVRGPFARSLLGAGVLCAAVLALAGGVALRGSGVVAVLLAGGVAACLTAGVVRETSGPVRTPPLEAAAVAGGWTIGGLLVLAGIAALGGSPPAVLAGAAGATAGLVVWMVRSARGRRGAAPNAAPEQLAGSGPVFRMPSGPAASLPGRVSGASGRADSGAARLTAPVTDLPTAALGSEWLRTTAALAGRLEPAARESIVRRRREALDELERRDPEGFARWLAAGPRPGSDPAEFVRGDPAGGSAS